MMPRIPHPALANPRRWRALRQFVLTRDGYRCQSCHRAAARFEVDHITPVSQGGDWWAAENAQLLCRNCHFFKSNLERIKPNPERDAWREYFEQKTVFKYSDC